MADRSSRPRSGCAVLTGLGLIAVGSVLLAHNLARYFGFAPLRVATQALTWFGTYWPVIFIGWGAYKLYVRLRHPERSFVTAAEAIVLTWILVAGLAVQGGRRAMEELPVRLSADDFAAVLGPDVLGPAHRAVATESFPFEGGSHLDIDNDRGRVVVRGSDVEGIEVTVTKQVYSFSESEARRALSEVELELETRADRSRLFTSRGERSSAVFTDLEIVVPRSTSVTITNQRGIVRVETIGGAVDVRTTHGDVEARELDSSLTAETSHATLRIENVRGPVVAKNRHGAILATGIGGELTADGSNSSISAEEVSGTADLRTRNGSVRAIDIAGEVAVDADYSDVSIERAGAGVSIEASHRPIFVSHVTGRVGITARHARIMVRSIEGDVTIDNEHRPVSVSEVRGAVEVSGESCSVEVDSVGRNVTISTSHEDIRVANFDSGVDIRSTHADIDLTTARLTGSVHVETSYGDVTVGLPPDASARVTAVTRDAELRSEFPDLASVSDVESGQRWEGVLGAGAHPVNLTTSYGDIVLVRVSP